MSSHRFLIGLLLTSIAAWADPRPQLALQERTNGTDLLKAVEPVLPGARAAAARITDAKGRHVASAVWVGADGYFLTKASETPELEKGHIEWAQEQHADIREIHRLPALDLVLAQAVGVNGVTPARFDLASSKPGYGQWLASAVQGGREIRIGVISAQPRKIPGLGAAMGIRMGEQPAKGGVLITGIAEDSPAGAAGLREGDVLLMIQGQPATDVKTVHDLIKKQQPGDQLEVQYRRKDRTAKARVRLASRTKIMMNWDGEDFANGGISIRTDNYASVLQHDLPLSPLDMGGALFDLEGKALGINIARVDRVTTFALPASVFWKEIEPLIEADRHPPKALRP